ncbi:MAG: iron-sulfur cluster-binding protein [SAR202 cluster bacterium Casp-Chloro-G4]|nr:LutB/LldF family L-lactate oxidation iron-sulfur protein [Chloroflexota bacterium]MDA1227785.1 LutB/LldF family L-lactate oxidation iron-sulfur protein [Chloroflexota bacterium]PKB61581.1 MAG: iron-sulfur cluster-binding protein [SAR202 cluster bacterium Casp-Chloro-G4]
MQPRIKQFPQLAAAALKDEQIQNNLLGLYNGFHQARIAASEATPNWDELSDRGRAIKAHTIDNLDYYLEMVERTVTAAGGKVFFAKDSDEATQYVIEVAKARGVKLAIKGKSMVSEEMGLNHRLEEAGIEPVETDLGEYIIQLADETPFHIIAPAIHKSKEQVSDLFQEKLGTPPMTEISDLAAEARRQLRKKFIEADMGITGANFVVAETGTVALVTNEGNGRMSTSMPKLHIAITGMEKVLPSIEDLGIMLRLLIRSATGQRISSYVTTVTGPRKSDDEDGPEEFHLVLVDNGRSKLLADPALRESLYCIRCGACLNACPVYRKVGGHAYGWVYPGPIGAIVSPMLTGLSDGKDLPYASSLCGACKEACPVKINIPRMLLYMRHQLAEGDNYPEHKTAPLGEAITFKLWRLSLSNSLSLKIFSGLARLLQKPFAKDGRINKLPPPLSAWTNLRTFPALASRPFRKRWKS